jgi:hypothetical protein
MIKARHVIWCTVPHVTIAALARGVGEKPAYSRYFTRYTHPWIKDEEFDATFHPCLLGDEVRAIDSAIDAFNDMIKSAVKSARRENPARDWLLLDICGLLDRLAYRRYLASPESRPDWWETGSELETSPYELPNQLKALSPRPDSRFFEADQFGRTQGGIVALDGVHPTTIGYGIAAQETIKVMAGAGVVFKDSGDVTSEAWVDTYWTRIIGADTMITAPPKSLAEQFELLRILNEQFDLIRHLWGNRPI